MPTSWAEKNVAAILLRKDDNAFFEVLWRCLLGDFSTTIKT